MPIFPFNKVFRASGDAEPSPDADQNTSETGNPRKEARRRASELRKQIRGQKKELRDIRQGINPASEKAERLHFKQSKKRTQQEIFRLKKELRAARNLVKEGPQDQPPLQDSAGLAETGASPDFVIIGGKKCGTSSLYDLVTRHPHVEPAASKELHYFDLLHEAESAEWYRSCFPAPRRVDGRWTITGEATPYMSTGGAPERMARVVPRARLIALLRNPVDRAYSDYQQVVRKGREPRPFEEAVEDENSEYLIRSVYVDQLLRWSEFFDRERILVLRSEDFFEDPSETLKLVTRFLDLPSWEPDEAEVLNKGTYTQELAPDTRRRLEDYFEPHNQRLYEYLGVDFGW